MKCDFHIHSSFSGDSDTPMPAMIERAITLGLDTICFTEHYDEDYPEDEENFSLAVSDYYETLCTLKKQYCSKINICFGVELGMQSHLGNLCTYNPGHLILSLHLSIFWIIQTLIIQLIGKIKIHQMSYAIILKKLFRT